MSWLSMEPHSRFKKLSMHKINLTICAAISTLFFVLSTDASGQEITPTVVHASGGSSVVNEVTVEWNVGESVVATLQSTEGISITSGQLQPMVATSDIDEVKPARVLLFPVPAREQLNITSEEMIEQVRIFDHTGRLVWEDTFYQKQIQLNISDLAAGIYHILLTDSFGHGIFDTTISKVN
jgi:hypothetical protein